MAARKKPRVDANLSFMPDPEWPELAGKPAPRADSLPSEVATEPGFADVPAVGEPASSELAVDLDTDPDDARPTIPVPRRDSVPPGVEDLDALLAAARTTMPTLSDEQRASAPTIHDRDPLRHDLPGLDQDWDDE